jgi:hypothetical protein
VKAMQEKLINCKILMKQIFAWKEIKKGDIERSNRIFREEFYARNELLAHTVRAFKAEIKSSVHKYNSYRTHQSIDFITSFEYIDKHNDFAN